MSVSSKITKNFSMGGETFNQSSTPSADGAIVHNITASAADAGSLTTRTDADTGVVTVDDSGHSFAESDRVDLYWEDGCRRGMSVSSVSGAEVSIDGGDGDDLPAADTELTMVVPTLLDVSVLGTNVETILLYSASRGQFVFIDDSSVDQYDHEIGASKSWDWEDGNGVTNPITGHQIEGVYASQASTTASVMKIGVLFNN